MSTHAVEWWYWTVHDGASGCGVGPVVFCLNDYIFECLLLLIMIERINTEPLSQVPEALVSASISLQEDGR